MERSGGIIARSIRKGIHSEDLVLWSFRSLLLVKEGGFRNGTYNVLLPKVTFESIRTVCLYSWSEEKRNVGNIDKLSVRGGHSNRVLASAALAPSISYHAVLVPFRNFV